MKRIIQVVLLIITVGLAGTITSETTAQDDLLTDSIVAVDWSPDGTQLVFGGESGALEIIASPDH
jgi:hypothetical protein